MNDGVNAKASHCTFVKVAPHRLARRQLALGLKLPFLCALMAFAAHHSSILLGDLLAFCSFWTTTARWTRASLARSSRVLPACGVCPCTRSRAARTQPMNAGVCTQRNSSNTVHGICTRHAAQPGWVLRLLLVCAEIGLCNLGHVGSSRECPLHVQTIVHV